MNTLIDKMNAAIAQNKANPALAVLKVMRTPTERVLLYDAHGDVAPQPLHIWQTMIDLAIKEPGEFQ